MTFNENKLKIPLLKFFYLKKVIKPRVQNDNIICLNYYYYFLNSINRMNLTTEQYLNLVDQMTMLRIENQRYKAEGSKLGFVADKRQNSYKQLSRQPALDFPIQQLPQNSSQQHQQVSAKIKIAKNEGMQQIKSSMTALQRNICQFIIENTTEQMNCVKQQILKIKQQIKDNFDAKVLKKQNNESNQKDSRKEKEKDKENVKPTNTIQESKEKDSLRQKDGRQQGQFYEKIKNLYMLSQKGKGLSSNPTLQEIERWVINFSLEPKQEYNPIKTIKEIRNSKKMLQFSPSKSKKQGSRKVIKQKQRQFQESDRITSEKLINHYRSEVQKQEKEIGKEREKDKQKKAIKKNNSLSQMDESELLRPKISNKGEEGKLKQKTEKGKLVKKSITLRKDGGTRSGDVKARQNKEAGSKKTMSESKNKINDKDRKKVEKDGQKKKQSEGSKKMIDTKNKIEKKQERKSRKLLKSNSQKDIEAEVDKKNQSKDDRKKKKDIKGGQSGKSKQRISSSKNYSSSSKNLLQHHTEAGRSKTIQTGDKKETASAKTKKQSQVSKNFLDNIQKNPSDLKIKKNKQKQEVSSKKSNLNITHS